MSDIRKDEEMHNQDLNAQNLDYEHYTGEVDSQRGRTAYSSAEKAFEQFNVAHVARIHDDAYLNDQRNRNLQITEDEEQMRIRHIAEEHEQRLRHQETEHQILMQQWSQNQIMQQAMQALVMRLLSGGITNEQIGARDILEQAMSLMSKTSDLTPPANVGK